jgi:hypothetical protein
VWSSAEEEEVE